MGCFSSKPKDSHRASHDVIDPEKGEVLGLYHARQFSYPVFVILDIKI